MHFLLWVKTGNDPHPKKAIRTPSPSLYCEFKPVYLAYLNGTWFDLVHASTTGIQGSRCMSCRQNAMHNTGLCTLPSLNSFVPTRGLWNKKRNGNDNTPTKKKTAPNYGFLYLLSIFCLPILLCTIQGIYYLLLKRRNLSLLLFYRLRMLLRKSSYPFRNFVQLILCICYLLLH